MGCIDEIGDRQRFVTMSFVDFLEGLARLAEALALPTTYELAQAAESYEGTLKPGQTSGFNGKFWIWKYLTLMGQQYLDENRRPSFGAFRAEDNESERSLHDKMDGFLHLMIAGLSETWNVNGVVDEAMLVQKLNRKTRLSGTIYRERSERISIDDSTPPRSKRTSII